MKPSNDRVAPALVVLALIASLSVGMPAYGQAEERTSGVDGTNAGENRDSGSESAGSEGADRDHGRADGWEHPSVTINNGDVGGYTAPEPTRRDPEPPARDIPAELTAPSEPSSSLDTVSVTEPSGSTSESKPDVMVDRDTVRPDSKPGFVDAKKADEVSVKKQQGEVVDAKRVDEARIQFAKEELAKAEKLIQHLDILEMVLTYDPLDAPANDISKWVEALEVVFSECASCDKEREDAHALGNEIRAIEKREGKPIEVWLWEKFEEKIGLKDLMESVR